MVEKKRDYHFRRVDPKEGNAFGQRIYEVVRDGATIGRVIGDLDYSGAKIPGTRLVRGRRKTPDVTWSWETPGRPYNRRYLVYREDAAEMLVREVDNPGREL